MMEARKEREAVPIHEKSEKQTENWLTWDEVVAKKNALWDEIKDHVSGKILTAGQFEKLIQFVVVSLYTDIPPRRNEYTDMYVVKKYNDTLDKAKNYYDITGQKFIFNKYKTQKTYGQQVVNVPEELQQTLALYLKHHPLAKSKAKEFKLLVKQDGSDFNTINSITRILNKTFGKKVGSSMLRHIYLSSKYGNITKAMEEDAVEMGHSTDVQREYIKQ
jgi:integrase